MLKWVPSLAIPGSLGLLDSPPGLSLGALELSRTSWMRTTMRAEPTIRALRKLVEWSQVFFEVGQGNPGGGHRGYFGQFWIPWP